MPDEKPKIPAVPKGTGPSGRRLWRAVLSEYELDEHELALLREAVRTVDTLDRLAEIVKRAGDIVVIGDKGPKVHPALVEARQLKIALARLLAALRLPEGEQLDGRPQRRVGVRGTYGLRSVG
jgi:hypothetical protein